MSTSIFDAHAAGLSLLCNSLNRLDQASLFLGWVDQAHSLRVCDVRVMYGVHTSVVCRSVSHQQRDQLIHQQIRNLLDQIVYHNTAYRMHHHHVQSQIHYPITSYSYLQTNDKYKIVVHLIKQNAEQTNTMGYFNTVDNHLG